MKLKIIIRSLSASFLLVCSMNAQAFNIDPEIDSCIKKNAPKASVIERIKMTSESLMSEEDDVLAAKIYWQHDPAGTSNILAVFDEPEDIYASRLLFLEGETGNEMFLYMPALFKVQRITTDRISSSMYGMDFSYEDLQWMYNMLSTAKSEQKDDVKINDDDMYVFTIVPQEDKQSKYETIYSYFDQKTCVIRKVEFYEQGHKLRKVLSSDPKNIKMVNGKLIPHVFLMRDLKKDSETVLRVISVEIDPPISKSLFDPAKLKEHRGIN